MTRAPLRGVLRPGRLVIVDLRDEFIEKDEALGLFVLLLQVFAEATYQGRPFNRLVVFDDSSRRPRRRSVQPAPQYTIHSSSRAFQRARFWDCLAAPTTTARCSRQRRRCDAAMLCRAAALSRL